MHVLEDGASPKRSRLHRSPFYHRFVKPAVLRSGRRRRSCRGEEVGECDLGFGGPHAHPIEGGPCEDDSASSRSGSSLARPLSNAPGKRVARAVRRGFSPCACPSSARRARVAERDDELRRERDLWRAAQTQIPREPPGV